MANGISRQFSVVALSEGVIYEIVPTSDSIVIPSGNTSVQFSVTASFYRREGQDVRSAYSCYATVYRRRGGTFTRVQYLSIRDTEIALENANVSVEDDALAIFIFDVNYTGTSPLTSQFLAKVELPVLKNGDNGMDTVNLDLDNENDSFLYDSLGVNHSQPVTSQARLYEGEETVSTGITWSISDFSGVTAIRTATNVDYDQSTYPSHAWVTPSGLLTVNGMNATDGYVTVCATYNEVEYRAKLTLRLIVNADKYDIAVNPSAIAYNNTTQTPANTTVKVNIYRTVIGIGRSALDSLPPGYTLSVYTSSGGTVTLTHASGSTDWTFSTVNSSYSSYRVVLTDVYNTVLDSETIPINKSSNGTNGSPGAPGDDAVGYEIVTDMDTLDAYTNQVSLNIRKTVGGVVTVFPCSNDQGQPFVTDGLSLSLAGALKSFVVYGSASKINIRNAPHANGATLIVRLLKGGVQVAEKQMRVSYLTQYLMTVSPSQVNTDSSGRFISDSDRNLTVTLMKILGNSEPIAVAGSADGLKVAIPGIISDGVYPDQNGQVNRTLTVGNITNRSSIAINLVDSEGTVINKETIPIVKSGAQGLQGCSTRVSEFKEDTEYVNQDGINMEGSPTFSIGYIDVVAVEMPKDDPRYEDSDGYFWYMCNVESTADYDYLAPANGEDTWYHRGQSDEKLVWKAIGVQGPSFFSLLIAKNAWIKFGSGNQFVIQDSEGNIVAGFTGYIPDADNEDRSVRIWAGGEDPALSPFRVLQSGDFYAEKAHVRGLVEVRDANEGLIVYDNVGNARVQVVADEVDEPVNEDIDRTGTRQSSYQIAADESFNLTPTPISLSLGELKTGAMLTVNGLSFTVSTNSGSTHIKLTKRNGIAEKMTVSLVLMDTNGNVESTLTSTYEATADTLIDDISFAFQGVLINTTKSYVMGVSAMIENINTYNSDADTWGGLARNATVTTVAEIIAKHATPIGTRIGTNGIFVNLDTGKSVSINASSTDIKYGSSRLRVSNNGAYLWDGSEYVPIVKKTKIITGNYTVLKEDGVIFIDSSSAVTITIDGASSSRDFTVISKQASVDYYITGVPVYRYDGTMYRDVPQRIDGQFPRRFVFDGLSSYYELFGGNF